MEEWLNISRKIDLTGKSFGRLKVLETVSRRGANKNLIWLCRCKCGDTVEVDSYSLRHGIVRSCGCLRREASAQRIRQNRNTKKFIGNPKGLKDKLGNPVKMIYVGKRNKSGIVGVSFDKSVQRWRARMMYKGEFKLNEAFEDFTDAVIARKNAEQRYLKH